IKTEGQLVLVTRHVDIVGHVEEIVHDVARNRAAAEISADRKLTNVVLDRCKHVRSQLLYRRDAVSGNPLNSRARETETERIHHVRAQQVGVAESARLNTV